MQSDQIVITISLNVHLQLSSLDLSNNSLHGILPDACSKLVKVILLPTPCQVLYQLPLSDLQWHEPLRPVFPSLLHPTPPLASATA